MIGTALFRLLRHDDNHTTGEMTGRAGMRAWGLFLGPARSRNEEALGNAGIGAEGRTAEDGRRTLGVLAPIRGAGCAGRRPWVLSNA